MDDALHCLNWATDSFAAMLTPPTENSHCQKFSAKIEKCFKTKTIV